jgi:hypothetical protein
LERLHPKEPSLAQAHLESFTHDNFPRLEVVRTLGVLCSCEHELKNVFIWWTERFDNVGIDLQDGEGVLWLYEEDETSERTRNWLNIATTQYRHGSGIYR